MGQYDPNILIKLKRLHHSDIYICHVYDIKNVSLSTIKKQLVHKTSCVQLLMNLL